MGSNNQGGRGCEQCNKSTAESEGHFETRSASPIHLCDALGTSTDGSGHSRSALERDAVETEFDQRERMGSGFGSSPPARLYLKRPLIDDHFAWGSHWALLASVSFR